MAFSMYVAVVLENTVLDIPCLTHIHIHKTAAEECGGWKNRRCCHVNCTRDYQSTTTNPVWCMYLSSSSTTPHHWATSNDPVFGVVFGDATEETALGRNGTAMAEQPTSTAGSLADLEGHAQFDPTRFQWGQTAGWSSIE